MSPLRPRVRLQPRRWRVLHAVIAAVAVLLLTSDVWQIAHLLVVHHVRCPYDGQLVHEDELPIGLRAGAEADPTHSAPLPVSLVPQHEHHECTGLTAVHRGHQALCTALAFHPYKPHLASGADDRTVLVWDPRTSSSGVSYGFLEETVTGVAWALGGKRLLAADAVGTVRAWLPG